jgi:hypothetical protein
MPFERGVNRSIDIGAESPPNLRLDTWRWLDANRDVSQRCSVARPVASCPVGLRQRGHNQIPPTTWNTPRLNVCDIDGGLECLCLSADSHLGSSKGLVLKHEDSREQQLAEHLDVPDPILIKVRPSVGQRLPTHRVSSTSNSQVFPTMSK